MIDITQLRFFTTCLLLAILSVAKASEISIDDTYTEIYNVQQELNIIKQYLKIDKEIIPPQVTLQVVPRLTWQKTYQILFKLDHIHEKYNLPRLNIPSREPEKDVSTAVIYEQVCRIRTELFLLKRVFDIKTEIPPPPVFTKKTQLDNYNALNQILYELDAFTGTSFLPSHVFGQAMRIHYDIDALLYALELTDSTLPPPKKDNVLPVDVFNAGLTLIKEMQEIQTHLNINKINLNINVYQRNSIQQITPTETFGMTGFVLAELQVIKAYLGLTNVITPVAQIYQGKIPADTLQILEWNIARIRLISKAIKQL
ncbi:hypothetical protein [Beggiatoa leptomitoformis]|uniref:Uncharacterized protein n=1 Tax=Beggiatoa leptomitoformis TaxID=288004 RepID=A0A2N9YAU8_9GAMM|nr:hypothetical protein [Beggiatoa leptomitoformis]ALG67027.1 hypothetical protein AL038_03965 [Beggiatoa leptomitoformis]AUI67595.1 hypothetical protein BLE401_02045 [Beggiatoa leptomitoformis]